MGCKGLVLEAIFQDLRRGKSHLVTYSAQFIGSFYATHKAGIEDQVIKVHRDVGCEI